MVVYRHEPKTTHFLNVDLDIYSRVDLQQLVNALAERVIVLYVGREKRTFSAHLEVTKVTRTAERAIREFCALIRQLPKAERKL
jgi:hypothetical protein